MMQGRAALFLLFALVLCVSPVFTQYPPTVHWASRVIIASSSYQPFGPYSAEQLLGEPNILSLRGTTNPCSWAADPQHDGLKIHDSTIKVRLVLGFDSPLRPRQLAVAENLNPGAIGKVTLLDSSGHRQWVVYDEGPQVVKAKWRMWNLFFDPPPFDVSAVELIVFSGAVPGWNEIDAVALATTTDTVKPLINIVDERAASLVPENLGTAINTRYSELLPVIAPDGNTIFFCRRGDPRNTGGPTEDIWHAVRGPDGQWQPAINLGPPLNNRGINFLCSILPDGKTALVGGKYLPDGRIAPGASLTRFDGMNWSFPKPLQIQDFHNRGRFVNYFLAADGRTLLMAIQRDDGYGGMDIFVSFLQPDSTWSRPLNLGPTINTAADEFTVFLAPDGKTLYFSSEGHNGYGSADLFISRRLDDSWTSWTKPQNLGPVINSPNWDGYFSIPATADYGYFVSVENSQGREDIFRVKLLPSMQPQISIVVGDTVYQIHDVLFELGSWELSEEAQQALRRLAAFLRNHPEYNLIVIGHTDDLDTEEFNLELSRQRAESVATFLQTLGIPPSRITIRAMGESQPLVPNTSEENRRRNRRVEFRLLRNTELNRGALEQP